VAEPGQEAPEVEPVRKVFWLKDEDLVAPEPDQEKFGQTDDPASLGWLLEEAEDLLEGQTLYFNPETTEILAGTQVQYYLDDTILAITWKEMHDYSVYTFSEVKIAHASQFRRFLAGGEYGSEKQFITTEMAASVNAVVASSGDFYRFRDFGSVVYQGQVRRTRGDLTDTCLIDDQGDLHFFHRGEVLDFETAQAFVDEHNIRFSLVFGPVLIEDGVRCVPSSYLLGEINESYARAGLCQMDKLHYLLATANTEGAYQHVPTLHQFAATLETTGCRHAYALDGGQTAAIVMNDALINRVVYGYQRKISDIIYFATAIPDGNRGAVG
jgi:exopolysaccharide biosynthesis protein